MKLPLVWLICVAETDYPDPRYVYGEPRMDGLSDAPPLGGAPVASVSSFTRHRPKSTSDLWSYHEAVLRHGTQLMALHTGEMAMLIRRTVDTISSTIPRVLVVGPGRVGKTTLVNALLGRPGLLPAHPTDRTAALTRLHLGQRGSLGTGAVITERVEGGASHGSAPVAGTQAGPKRAGSLVARLLGTGADAAPHAAGGLRLEFDDALADAPEIARHLTAPYARADTARRVDIFLEHSPLSFPVQIIDTPPLVAGMAAGGLPADAVEEVDACLVVLDAAAPEQALDPALLEVIFKVPVDRLVVVLNPRSSPASDGEAIRARASVVRRLLRQRLQTDVPVVCVELADAMPKPAHQPLFRAVVKDFPFAAQDKGRGPTGLDAARNDEAVRSVPAVDRLAEEIERCALDGPYARRLMEVATTLRDIARLREEAARSSAVAINNRILDIQKEQREAEDQLQRIEYLIADIKDLSEGIEKSCESASGAIRVVQDDAARLVRQMLEALFNRFLTEQTTSLQAAVDSDTLATWRCDTSQWRREFEEESARLLRHLRLKLFEALRQAVDEFRNAIGRAIPELRDGLDMMQPSANFYLPSLEMPIRPIVFRFENGGWLRRLRARPQGSVVVEDLKRHLIAEFDDAAKATVEQMTQGLAKDAAIILFRLSQKSISVIDMMVERREQLVRQADTLLQLQSNANTDRLLAAHAIEQQEAERVVLTATQITRTLSDLVSAGTSLVGGRRLAAGWQ
jgi:hypothetical protein